MKKLIATGFAVAALFSPFSGHAEGYNTLKFTSTNGETVSVETGNLEIIIQEDCLTFNNVDLILPLSSLESMEFSDHYDAPASVEGLNAETDGKTYVYDLEGKTVGTFPTVTTALNSLSKGVYVIKTSNGKTLKVSVGK